MSKINMHDGTLFIGSPSCGLLPIGEIAEGKELILTTDAIAGMGIETILTDEELNFSVSLSKQQIERFLQVALGITRMVLEILHGSGNRRVAYLARHAKKRRTRKKNIRRAYRLVSDERSCRNEQA